MKTLKSIIRKKTTDIMIEANDEDDQEESKHRSPSKSNMADGMHTLIQNKRISQSFVKGFSWIPPGDAQFIAFERVSVFHFPPGLTQHWTHFYQDAFLDALNAGRRLKDPKQAATYKFQNSLMLRNNTILGAPKQLLSEERKSFMVKMGTLKPSDLKEFKRAMPEDEDSALRESSFSDCVQATLSGDDDVEMASLLLGSSTLMRPSLKEIDE